MSYFRKFNRFILFSLALLGVSVTSANAALVTELLGLDVDGTLYDVTLHTGGDEFIDLWDGDNDGVFEADGSLFDSAPTFWGDSAGAQAAAESIIVALGVDDCTGLFLGGGCDSFRVPFQFPGLRSVEVYTDLSAVLDIDEVGLRTDRVDRARREAFRPYASFTRASEVPVPATVWLFGTALIGLVGFSKRKSRSAA